MTLYNDPILRKKNFHRSQIFHKTGKKKHFRHFLEKFDQKIALFLVKFFQKVPKNAFSCLFCEKFDCGANFFSSK